MSSKKKLKKKGKTSQLNGIQLASIGIILVIVATVIWIFLANRNSSGAIPTLQPSTQSAVTQSPTNATTPNATPNATAVPQSTIQAPTPSSKQYPSEPPMTIDVKKQYFANVKMAKGGEFVIQLFPDKAPRTVNSFVFLAKDGFFNGVTFHRVLDGFMAQGGDPTGTGGGGPGYEFANEKNDLNFDKAGVVAMANAGPDTNGSQFFIMFGPYGLSESNYTIFGQVTSGMDVVNGLTRRDPDTNPTFPGDAIATVTITEK